MKEEILESYKEHEDEITARLAEFEDIRESSDYRHFIELCFVILTSQSSAKNSWEATEKLDENDLLLNGTREEIAEVLQEFEIQYEERKADYIVKNREKLSQPTLSNPTNELKIKEKLRSPEKARDWLVDSMAGVSWKGASHFLRNTGRGDFAIISSYILKTLYSMELVESAEPPKKGEEYKTIENKLRKLAEELGLELQELDLAIWAMETGEVFK